MREDASDEEGFGKGEEPYETSVCCDLVLDQVLRLQGGGREWFNRDQNHLAEVRGGCAGPVGPVAAHDLQTGI